MGWGPGGVGPVPLVDGTGVEVEGLPFEQGAASGAEDGVDTGRGRCPDGGCTACQPSVPRASSHIRHRYSLSAFRNVHMAQAHFVGGGGTLLPAFFFCDEPEPWAGPGAHPSTGATSRVDMLGPPGLAGRAVAGAGAGEVGGATAGWGRSLRAGTVAM